LKALIITPACNEELHLNQLIDSVVNQSTLPSQWIIVDDGSTDSTSSIIEKASIDYPWINYLRKPKADLRSPGKSVMEAFYYGYNKKGNIPYDIIMKIDADLILPVNYIESVVKKMVKNQNIGICGGVCLVHSKGHYIIENETNLDHVRGAIKAYRKSCFDDIGGLLKNMGWDTVDEHYARFKGWEVCVLVDLEVIHQRSTYHEYGFIKAAFRNGKMLYSIRMGFLLLLSNCIKKAFKPPYIILGISMLLGYCFSFVNREDKIVDPDLGVFIRNYRWQKIRSRFNSLFTLFFSTW